MKNILLPTDFSENSWNAILYALSFFKKVPCNFYILHISPYNNGTNGISIKPTDFFLKDDDLKSVSEQFESLIQKIEKLPLNSKHVFATVHEDVFFVDSIRKQITEKNIDFVVMGTKGATGLKERTIGSKTGDVITKVKCPVLIIPEKAKYRKPKEIAFPTDYNIYFKYRVLNTLTNIIALNNSTLRVVHIFRKNKELTNLQKKNKLFLDDYLGEEISHSFHSLSNPNIEQAVEFFVESRDIGLIAMIAKNLNFFQRILFHPTVEKISYHSNIPFLVLHE